MRGRQNQELLQQVSHDPYFAIMSPHLFIFVALACEAKALIQHWRLKKSHQEPFVIFKDDSRAVVITGVGKIATAAAVAHTMALFPRQNQQVILLNIGIAGHRYYPLGSLYLADKIINAETGKRFYPQLSAIDMPNTATVQTVASPVKDYPTDDIYEMEAAGFYEIAIKFSSSELIHSLKVISDNASSGIEHINEALVELWLGQHLKTLDTLLNRLHALCPAFALENQALFNELSSTFHFTASATIQLKKLLQSWQLLNTDTALPWQASNCKNAKDLLRWLEALLENRDFYL